MSERIETSLCALLIMTEGKDLLTVLWSGADVLRDKMDANEYKTYLLGLVFYKYLSDSYLAKGYDLLNDAKPDSLDEAQSVYEEAMKSEDAPDLLEEIKDSMHYTLDPDMTYISMLNAAKGGVTMANTPNIRFKGFTDDWERHKLGDFGKATGGTSIESEFSEDGIYKVISIGSYSENGVYNDQGLRAVESEKTINRILNKGDITMILNDKTTSGNIIGRVLLIEKSGVYVYNQRTERIEINTEKYDSLFIYEMLNAPKIRDKIRKQSQGNTQIYVNWPVISLTEYFVPQKEEQRKIGQYFQHLDHLIILHQCKCDKVKQLKKFMLQKMFPKSGELIPEIRFAGFTDDWEQRKLGELSSSLEYGLNVSAKEFDGKNKYIRITDIDDSSHEFVMDGVTSPDIDLSTVDDYKLFSGDILFARTGASVGKSYIYRDSDGIVYFAGFLIRARIKKEYNPEFVFQNTLTTDYEKFIMITSQRSGQPGVNAQEYSEYKIMIPKRDEQDKISAYLSNLDLLITLHQRKCDELQSIKKFMLKKMFV